MKKIFSLAKAETLKRRRAQPVLSALRILPKSGPRLLAVSGGSDSRALMEGWARHEHRGAFDVVVCVDHGVRAAARAEAEAVVDRARVLGFSAERVTLFRLQDAAFDEASLRKLRYEALLKVARRVGADEVLLAHHRDDDVESAFLHLLGQGGAKEGAALPLRAPLLGGRTNELWAVRPFRSLYKTDLQMALLAWGIVDVNIDDDDVAQRNARSKARAFLAAQQEYPQLNKRLYAQSVLARERVLELEFAELESTENERSLDENAEDVQQSALRILEKGVRGSRSSTRQLLERCASHWSDPRDAKPVIDAIMQALLEEKPHARKFQLRDLQFVVQRDEVKCL